MGAPASKRRNLEGARVRKLDGEVVRPVLYNGRSVGHGKYFAASVNGQLVLDANEKPVLFREAGTLERV